MSALSSAVDRLRASYEEVYGSREPAFMEPPFRPDFRAALRVEQVRMARLRLKLAKQSARQAAGTVWAYANRVKVLTTDATPCSDCHQPIGNHRRFTGQGGVLCEECEREAFGH